MKVYLVFKPSKTLDVPESFAMQISRAFEVLFPALDSDFLSVEGGGVGLMCETSRP